MLTAYSDPVHADATSIIVFDGPANVSVAWTVTAGPGAITALSDMTDGSGRAYAIYDPAGSSGTATIQVTHG